MGIETYQFNSTNVDSADWDDTTHELVVTFLRDGRQYTVSNVTPQEWAAFQFAPSPGGFFRSNFKSRAF